MKILHVAAGMALAGSFLASPAGASQQRHSHPPRIDQILAVTNNHGQRTITVYEGPEQQGEFTITGNTRILIDGKPSSANQLKKGMTAYVGHQPDSTNADLVNAENHVRWR